LIPENDLQLLRAFNGHGRTLVSAYLRLDSPEYRQTAYEEFMRQMQTHLENCQHQPQCREAVREDMEIVGLYLKTNGQRNHKGLALFSCAAELFWRAYPLSSPVPNRVTVGPAFDLEPLTPA
jgi:hypothetical protein